jgi:signal transduction histidine kinase
MKKSLKLKLIFSYLIVALVTVLVVSVLIRLTSGKSLMNLVVEEQTASLADSAETYYGENGSLSGFFDYYQQQNHSAPAPIQSDAPPNTFDKRNVRGVFGMVDSNYQAIMPTFNYEIGQTVPKDQIKDAIPVKYEGKTIAWILPDTKFQFSLSNEEQVFLQRTTTAIGLAALAGILIAVVMGFLLAGRIVKPIRQLTLASQELARGALKQQVPVTSQDELGQLTKTFNQMSTELDQVDMQRKRMTADITHDLSTPLQIISGYMEMLEDGKVTLTPQRINIIKTEIEHLRRLVSDLTTLSQVEGGGLDFQYQPVQPSMLLERVYQTYQPIANQQNVDLILDISPSKSSILVDEGRMLQVLKNLVENSLRHTPSKGRIILGLLEQENIQIRVSDNGSGIDAEDLPYVFDRFYRADKVRGSSSGKMGLGLAICKALVTAQGGVIFAESEGKDKGTTIVMTFKSAVLPKDQISPE